MTMPALSLTITQAGWARFTAAQLAGDIDLSLTHLGLTAAAFVVAPTLTALPGEFRRIDTISGQVVGDGILTMTVQDTEPVTYGVRGFGLYLDDGTLFAVYGQAQPIVTKASIATLLVAIDIAFPMASVDGLTFGNADFLYPPATTDTKGVAAIATQAEVEAGADAFKIVTSRTLASRLQELLTSILATLADTVADYIPLAQKAQAGGVATLDAGGHVLPAQLALAMPVGAILLWAGAAAPAGWAICDGSQAQLADGTGAITTPDLRGRVAVGVSADHALGTAFGATIHEADTLNATTGMTLNTAVDNGTAQGGSGTRLTSASLTDPGHHHHLSIDVTQPSIALNFIIKL